MDTKIHETVETINQLKSQREFMLEFSKDPQEFLQRWIVSQARDLKTMAGNDFVIECNHLFPIDTATTVSVALGSC